jgi:hypothetical protein
MNIILSENNKMQSLLLLLLFIVFLDVMFGTNKEMYMSSWPSAGPTTLTSGFGSYQNPVNFYEYRDIPPFGYGYRPYYGYNLYLYGDNQNVAYNRPILIPTYREKPFKMYGMY